MQRAAFGPSSPRGRRHRACRGGVAVESALALAILLGLVLAAIDAARWLFALHATGEAVREGARTAVVCSLDAGAAVRERASPWLALAAGSQAERLSIEPEPAGCVAHASQGSPVCTGVRVRLREGGLAGLSWWLPQLGLPPVQFFLTRESMDSTDNPARCG